MGEIGTGAGSSYPATLDTDSIKEANSSSASKTKARAEVVNDLAAAVVAIEKELGKKPALNQTDVKTALQKACGNRCFTAFRMGILVDEEVIFDGLTFTDNITITKIHLNCQEAPVGADVTVDLTLGQAENGTVATLTDSTKFETTDITDVDVTAGTEIGLKIKSIGTSGLEGQDLTVTVHYEFDYT